MVNLHIANCKRLLSIGLGLLVVWVSFTGVGNAVRAPLAPAPAPLYTPGEAYDPWCEDRPGVFKSFGVYPYNFKSVTTEVSYRPSTVTAQINYCNTKLRAGTESFKARGADTLMKQMLIVPPPGTELSDSVRSQVPEDSYAGFICIRFAGFDRAPSYDVTFVFPGGCVTTWLNVDQAAVGRRVGSEVRGCPTGVSGCYHGVADIWGGYGGELWLWTLKLSAGGHLLFFGEYFSPATPRTGQVIPAGLTAIPWMELCGNFGAPGAIVVCGSPSDPAFVTNGDPIPPGEDRRCRDNGTTSTGAGMWHLIATKVGGTPTPPAAACIPWRAQ